jgi:hypothetical protein
MTVLARRRPPLRSCSVLTVGGGSFMTVLARRRPPLRSCSVLTVGGGS